MEKYYHYKVTQRHSDGAKVTSYFWAESAQAVKSFVESTNPDAKVTFIEELYFD